MILYSKIRWWLLGLFATLITWGSINYLAGRNVALPTILFVVLLVAWFVVDKILKLVKHDIQ